MSVKYRTVKRRVLAGEDEGQTKTYGVAKASYYCDMDKLCELVASRSAMSSGDVKSMLDSLNWVIGLEMRSGAIVQVGELGNFRLSLRTEGVPEGGKFTADQIKRAVNFEEDDVKVVTVEEPEDVEDGPQVQ